MLPRKFRSILPTIRNVLFMVVILILFFVYTAKKNLHDEVETKIPKSAIKYIQFEPQEEQPLQMDTIRRLTTKYNSEDRIVNLDFFGPLKPEAPIFVIFVDKYKVNLKYLLVSLSQVRGIEDALIIFSHLSYDENVISLIKTIDFVRVLEIFYPYSIQLYPNEFPGYQGRDCPSDMDIDTALAINCTGADSPDIHGRFRNPMQTQIKHYWWWTMNKVFESTPFIKDHQGIFTFLEDDVFLMEDFIFMSILMKKVCTFITNCDFISLTSNHQLSLKDLNTYNVEIATWDHTDHLSVLSFDASVWRSIAAHYHLFCSIDDYSWSRSLYYLSLNRKDGGRFKVMSSVMPRAFKTSSTAYYENFIQYDMMNIVFHIIKMQERNKAFLYPAYLEVYLNIELEDDEFMIFDYVDNNGGWNDPRDKQMCYNLTTNKIKRVIMEMDHEFHQYDPML